MSSQVSSTGTSGVVSIAPSADAGVDDDGPSSGCFSGLLGGGFGGGGVEDIFREVNDGRAYNQNGINQWQPALIINIRVLFSAFMFTLYWAI